MDVKSIKKAGYYISDEITEKQPFPSGVCGCRDFRIPGLIRLADGSLFATSDARWTDADSDYGGIDTAFAISRDGGEHWSHGYAALFPDTLGTPDYPFDSTTCIDPDPVQTPDGVIHIFVNMLPTGVAFDLHRPVTGNGFISVNGRKYLALTDDISEADDPRAFRYYLGEYEGGFARIFNLSGEYTGFAADGYFNIYAEREGEFCELYQPQIGSGEQVVQNVFYRDSSFHVLNTMFTLDLFSDDLAKTWRCRTVSGEIKSEKEDYIISSPGNAVVTRGGRAVLPFYYYSEERANSFLVMSDDCFVSFYRSPYLETDAKAPSRGESKAVELPDGNIRLFYRNSAKRICYADYILEKGEWREAVVLPVLVHSDCNFAAVSRGRNVYIIYARGRGCEAMNRANGRVYSFLLGENCEMILEDIYPVNNDAFSYAVGCFTDKNELAVLYDTCELGKVIFKTIDVTSP